MRQIVILVWAVLASTASGVCGAPPLPTVPEGFEIEVAAEFPVVERPVMACFDERGRLYLVDSAGVNEPFEKLVKDPPHRIVVIEDTDGDGKFDKRTVFADKLVMPQGVLPYRGAVYTASPPSVWKLDDTDGDGVCDKRTEILTEFGSNGNAADIHGPFLGPDGWLYICDGRHGHKVKLADGSIDQGLAGGIFRFRIDGSGFHRVCGGGFDNPVEIVFTDEGEMLGTVNILHGNPRQDCLMHWVEGGVYPRADQEPCIAEFKRTGDLLPPIKEFGHVAVSGLTRYQSEGFGPEYKNNLFITFFNRHKVIRSILEPSGSTFTSREEEFLSSNEKDFHPTDVLEDADGSLLVINTGGWFRLGCPVSEIAKPDVLGAIYRVRKKGMRKIDDPHGLALGLEKRPREEVVKYLDDPRPAVRERAIGILAAGDPRSTAEILCSQFTINAGHSTVLRMQNSIWTAKRILANQSLSLAQSSNFANAKTMQKIGQTVQQLEPCMKVFDAGLCEQADLVQMTAAAAIVTAEVKTQYSMSRQLVVEGNPHVRRAAATAIGSAESHGRRRTDTDDDDTIDALTDGIAPQQHIRRSGAIFSLFESFRKGNVDRFLEHALVYSLIQINDRKNTLPYLSDPNPEIRRAALIALDQMQDGRLTRDLVTPLLDTDDPQLRKAALDVIASHKGWAAEMVELLRGWLAEQQPSEEHLSLLRGVLLAQAGDKEIQRLIGETLVATQSAPAVRLLAWEVVDRAPLTELPADWMPAIERALAAGSPAEIRQVVAVVDSRKLAQFAARLAALASDAQVEMATRVEALAVVAFRLVSLDSAKFELLAANIQPETPPLVLLAAARGLADAPLDAAQLHELTQFLPRAGPLALPVLIRAFNKSGDTAIGMEFVAALEKTPASDNLSAEELAGILRKYAPAIEARAAALLTRLGGGGREQQKTRLKELAGLIEPGGDALHGRGVFFGKNAACANCHTVANEGGRVGPDLTKIGASRSGTDLLEAIVFPSATFAREFRPYIIATDAGKVYTGIITRQTADAVHLRTADLAEIRIARSSIEEMKESNTSIMPKGLDAVLSSTELRDLLAYLQQLK
jgi:putative membrane-bound dehydrogenase-like protein